MDRRVASNGDGGREALARLGTGGHGDSLDFRLVLQIFWRTLPFIAAVKGDVLRLLGVFAPLAAFALLLAFLGNDLFFNRMLAAEPLTPLESRLLFLDTERFVEVDALDTEARRVLRGRLVLAALGLIPVFVPAALYIVFALISILQRINQVLRVRLLERVQALSLRFHADSRVGDAIYRVYQDSAMVTSIIQTIFFDPLRMASRYLFSLLVVAAFDVLLALVLLLLAPLGLLLGRRFSPPLRAGFRSAREANSRLTSRIQEAVAGIKVIKAFGAERVEQERFERDSLDAFDHAFRARSRYALFAILAFVMAGAALLLVELGSALLAESGAPTLTERALVVFGFAAWNLGAFSLVKERGGAASTGIEQLLGRWGRAQDMAIGLDRVFELLDLEPEVEDAPDAAPLAPFEDRIVFREVSFGYDPERPVLSGVSFESRAGTITAIVGPTGAGKSTLVSLLLRLFDPDAGAITIDGVDLRRLTVESLRANVAIALQENLLFGTSVRENIRYAVPDASDAQVREAARIACAEAFIEALPEGYDTLLGERGAKLSTGQRQRLSIARAVLKDAPILILDEPTAALDAETELAVLRNLAAWGRGRAIFLITHRPSTIRRADQILVLHDGRLVEKGTHAELAARPGGAYRALVDYGGEPADRAGRAERRAAGDAS